MVVANWKHFVYQKGEAVIASGTLQVRLHCELVIAPPNVYSFNRSHCEQQILNQKRLLNVGRERAKRFGSFLCDAGSAFDQPCKLLRYVVVVQMRALE